MIVVPASPDRYWAKIAMYKTAIFKAGSPTDKLVLHAAGVYIRTRGIIAPRRRGNPIRLMEWVYELGMVRWAAADTIDWSALRTRIESDPRWRDALDPVTAWVQSLVDAALEAEDNISRPERRAHGKR